MTESIRKIGGVAVASQKKISGVERGSVEKVAGVKSTYGTFAFTIETAGADTFTLPLGTSSNYKFDMIVSWGDGEADSTITAYDDADRTHSYTGAGTYTVTLKGKCEYFGFSTVPADKDLMKTLVSFSEDIGLKLLNFDACINLTTLCSFGKLESLTNAAYLFRDCTSLTGIVAGMFDDCPNITSFRCAFDGCDNVSFTTIPTDLFKYNTKVISFYYVFNECRKITAIPSGLFDYNTLVTVFYGAFRSTFVAAIPTDLFKYNVNVTNFSGLFVNDSKIEEIPVDLFRYNTQVTTFANTFYSTDIQAIPDGMFDYNTLAGSFSSTFINCNEAVNALDGTIFEFNTIITSLGNCFKNCSGLTGNEWGDGNTPDETPNTIIYNAEHQDTPPTTIDGCFEGCTSLTDAGSIPLAWR